MKEIVVNLICINWNLSIVHTKIGPKELYYRHVLLYLYIYLSLNLLFDIIKFCSVFIDWLMGMLMVFNATFNNISAKSWRSVLLVKETRVPGQNHALQTTLHMLTNAI